MVYYIKLTVENSEEISVQDICNTAFKQLDEKGLNVIGVQVTMGKEPGKEDELILEKSLSDDAEPVKEKEEENVRGENVSGNLSMMPESKPASQIMPGDGSGKHKAGWSTKPSSITDDGKNKTWDFGTKWI